MDKCFDFGNRRSIRRFSDKKVNEAILSEMLLSASHAPTTGNMQLCSAVVTSNPDALRRMAECHFNQPASVSCPAIVTFCIDVHRFERWCEVSDARPGFRNLQGLFMGVLDTALLAQQFVTLAETAGLGSCYLGTTLYNASQISLLLNLPNGVVPLIAVAVGYPDESPAASGRLPLSAVVHTETYHDFTDDEVRELYREKEGRADSAQFVKENEKETLAQVFTDVRYPGSQLVEFSELLGSYLDKQYFNK